MTQIKSKFFYRQDAKPCLEHVEGAQRNATKKLRVLRAFAVSKKNLRKS
jgi:hypothetical protein